MAMVLLLHSEASVTAHARNAEQHTPVGHGFAAQVVPYPANAVPTGQEVPEAKSVQAKVALSQQAPRGRQEPQATPARHALAMLVGVPAAH